MSHDTVDKTNENSGSERTVVHDIDITSLDAAGKENYDPAAETDVSRANTVEVVGIEDPSYTVQHDHVAGGLHVKVAADGTDVASGTAVGQVRVRVQG